MKGTTKKNFGKSGRSGAVLAFACLFIMAMALVFGFAACDNGTTEEDTWSDVTSLEQMDGTWKGSYSQTATMQEYVESNDGTWDSTTATMFGDMRVTTTVELTMVVDAAASTGSGSMKVTVAFSGGNIALVWELGLKTQFSGEGVTVDDNAHSVTMTLTIPSRPITLADDFAGAQINQDGTKAKMPADEEAGTPEIIFVKQ
jgi:hypothetical protein